MKKKVFEFLRANNFHHSWGYWINNNNRRHRLIVSTSKKKKNLCISVTFQSNYYTKSITLINDNYTIEEITNLLLNEIHSTDNKNKILKKV